MEIGNDVLDDEFVDDFDTQLDTEDIDDEIVSQDEPIKEDVPEYVEDFMTSLLKSKGIEDKSKIKFENESGEIEEMDWDNLSVQDKLNIINSSDNDLDESEIQLLNEIRKSGLTTTDYFKNYNQRIIDNYVNSNSTPQYTVDQYTDDELFIADFMAKYDVDEAKAIAELEHAKADEEMFNKKIGAIRNEYKEIEDGNAQQERLLQEQQAQEQFNQFSDKVVNEINELKEYSGYELNLEDNDMQQLYDFITGVDSNGVNHFAKALSDPKTLVKTAWLALNGDQLVNDITDYFQKEITRVRKESYEKGKQDKNNNVVFKQKSKKTDEYDFDDIDEF